MTLLTPDELEALLGDPGDNTNPYGFAAAVERDERDEFPTALCDELRRAGFHLNYLPKEWGGELQSFDRSLTLVRSAARRDVNIMPGTMFSIIAATCLQLHGTPEQQSRAAEILTRGGAVAFALTEAEHGSDLLTNEVRLSPEGELTGEKWMVGLGMSCEAVYVIARTGERGPGAFSAVLLDLADVPDGQLERTPAVRTGGMRGIDMACLRFNGLTVPEKALVGKEGEGLEAAVKAQQAVRLMSMAGSLGIADTAVRLALDFATTRRIGRTVLTESPHPRRELAVAAAALLAADTVALTAARGVHVVPEAFSVWALAAKHVVAEATDELIRRCGTVLATRSVLREGERGAGLFQKLQRDSAVVRVIDASTLANLRSFAGQLPTLTEGAAEPDPAAVAAVYGLDADLPAYEPARLDMFARGVDPVLAGLPDVATDVADALGDDESAAPVVELVGQLARAVAGLGDLTRAARERGADPNALVDAAERYAWLHAAASCVHLWWANRDRSLYGTQPGSAGWLGATLGYLLARADGVDPRHHGAVLTPALDAVVALRETGRLFSALPVRLATTR
ncbi:alkylation response protein AidB-like acyl-CoA dehydrogenase [Streptomyces sp. SLBN-118]|uniref:acyl-CoA dehydrogenase family protein n=1 Tax=Streptomyces sp. SLBN-118 TaxID=2768454 RepID=UPI00114D9DBC|nr:acyl-CoA dehydrogenase family protein [Streptomyces sp. SLBN-118]TQK44215.1 alkylation response protein AidB-like acyl-CoA dehydrogenase [Streptomyces sp. SLBN-118]